MVETRTAERESVAEQRQIHVGCGCGLDAVNQAETVAKGEDGTATRDVAQIAASNDERRAVAVDPGAKTSNLNRLRRIEGQVRGLQRMVDEDRYCADILMQISSVQEALRAVGRELMRNHLRHCAAAAIRAGSEEEAEAMYDEILELMYRHGR